MSQAASVIFAVARKDVITELRSRESLASMLLFAIIVVVIFSFATQGAQDRLQSLPGLMWATFIFAGLIGLSRTFGCEERDDCLQGLSLAPVGRHLIYLGKVAGNVLFMLMMESLVLVLFVVFLDLPLMGSLPSLAATCVLGTVGFSAVGTLFSAMSLGARTRETLLPALVVPIILPVMIFAVTVTQHLLSAPPDIAAARSGMTYLAILAVLYTTVASLTFEFVLGD